MARDETRDALLLFRVGERVPDGDAARDGRAPGGVPARTIERAGGRPAVQYRNEILPLVSVTHYFGRQTSRQFRRGHYFRSHCR